MKMGKGSCYSRRNSGEWNRAVVGRRKASEWQTDRLRVECGGDDAGTGCVRNGCGSEETKPTNRSLTREPRIPDQRRRQCAVAHGEEERSTAVDLARMRRRRGQIRTPSVTLPSHVRGTPRAWKNANLDARKPSRAPAHAPVPVRNRARSCLAIERTKHMAEKQGTKSAGLPVVSALRGRLLVAFGYLHLSISGLDAGFWKLCV